MDATREDVAAHLHATFATDDHERVRGQLARLEDAPGVRGDAARVKVAALIVADGDWSALVQAVELGLS